MISREGLKQLLASFKLGLGTVGDDVVGVFVGRDCYPGRAVVAEGIDGPLAVIINALDSRRTPWLGVNKVGRSGARDHRATRREGPRLEWRHD